MDKEISGWYSSESSISRSETILREAYEEGVLLSSRELGQDQQKVSSLVGAESIEDFKQIVLDLKNKYHTTPHSKTRRWLGLLSLKVTHWSPILDVLSQGGQQYGSLVWGLMKFLFVAIANHEEMVSQLSKACSNIADMLPRTELSLILYPTDTMKEAVAILYARILKFIQHSISWYKQGRIAHAWSAIAKPWVVSFKDFVDDIGEQSRHVDRLASGAFKAELRDTHNEICETHEDLKRVHLHIQQILQMTHTTLSTQNEIKLDVRACKGIICNIQLTQILSLPFMNGLPTSGESLGYCQSLRLRRKEPRTPILKDTSKLQEWASQPHTSFLVVDCSTGQAAKDFLVDVVNLIRTTRFPAIWALRFPDFWKKNISCIDILRILLLQAIQINPDALTSGSHPLTMAHFREAVDEDDWRSLLARALEGIQHVYIVIDSDLLAHAMGNNRYLSTRWIGAFSKLATKTVMKVFISAFAIDTGYAARNWDPSCWSKLQTDISTSRRNFHQRRIRASRRRALIGS